MRSAGGELAGPPELALQRTHQSIRVGSPTQLRATHSAHCVRSTAVFLLHGASPVADERVVVPSCGLIVCVCGRREHRNDGISVDPYEVMFVKVKAHLLDLGATRSAAPNVGNQVSVAL